MTASCIVKVGPIIHVSSFKKSRKTGLLVSVSSISDISYIFNKFFITDATLALDKSKINHLGKIAFSAMQGTPLLIIMSDSSCKFIPLSQVKSISNEIIVQKPCHFRLNFKESSLLFSCYASTDYTEWMHSLESCYQRMIMPGDLSIDRYSINEIDQNDDESMRENMEVCFNCRKESSPVMNKKDELSHPPSYPFNIPNARPKEKDRKFQDKVVESVIDKVKSHFLKMGKPEWGLLFENVFPNTLDTTVFHSTGDTFIITGDIPAMWLRDSTNQCAPYMPLLSTSNRLKDMIKGLISRQTKCILSDIWANAFKENAKGPISEWAYDDKVKPPVSDLVFECKFELDSLAAFFKLSRKYIQITDDVSIITSEWKDAVCKCLTVMKMQQSGTDEIFQDPPYLFQRSSNVPTDTLMLNGLGPPAKRCGLMQVILVLTIRRCGFRPSDDAVTLPFLIPANAMAYVELTHLSNVIESIDSKLAHKCKSLAQEINDGIKMFGIVKLPNNCDGYAYEVDGFGNKYFMDDANIPSLLSLPYLEFVAKDDPLYLATRKWILSENNPYYFKGKECCGIGGPHIGLGYIWPMSIAIQALTAVDMRERASCMEILLKTTAGTGLIHESFWKDGEKEYILLLDSTKYTRKWFAWANSLVGELLYQMARESGCDLP